MQTFHPVFVHFPIALAILAAALELAGAAFKHDGLKQAAAWNLRFAFLGALAALRTGFQAEEGVPHESAAHEIMELHETLAIVFTCVAGALAALSFFFHKPAVAKLRPVYALLLVAAAVTVGYGGHLGGTMVYEHGIGTETLEQLQRARIEAQQPPAVDAKEPAYLALVAAGKCIVMPEEDIDERLSVEYDGATYYFCCKKCIRKFNEDPQAYLK